MNFIFDLQYFPSISLIKSSYQYSHIIFEQYEHYPKSSFRNRMFIANANGIVTLSIPILGGRSQHKCYKEIRMDNRKKWKSNHLKNMESAYNRSPWFSFYRPALEVLYGHSDEFLVDWNMSCFEWILIQLERRDIIISTTETYRKDYDPVHFVDKRQTVSPSNYTLEKVPKYQQVFEDKLGFLPNLSILDLLFCEGPGAGRLLQQG
jgi:hypothetical protein